MVFGENTKGRPWLRKCRYDERWECDCWSWGKGVVEAVWRSGVLSPDEVEESQTFEARLQEEDGRAEALMKARNDLEEALYAAKGEELGEGLVSHEC